MSNSHEEIRKLLRASREMLSKPYINEEYERIRKSYGIITEDSVTSKDNIGSSIENKIEDDTDDEDFEEEKDEDKEDKKQAYRISGGVIVLHGKETTDLDLTTDEKTAFQETMDEFVNEVSDMSDFNKLNVYPKNVEWSGKIIDSDIEFFFSLGEENGCYIQGKMIQADDEFLELITKLKTYYDKFKSKWAKVLASRKKTKKDE